MAERPGVLVGGLHSGSGKTLVTLALLHGLEERGYRVRPFKCGPDFIDPRFHEWMTGRTSVNLDLFFSGAEELPALYDRMTRSLSGGVVEGVMGFYDGLDRGTSTYDVARALGLPVVLAVYAKGMADTVAAVVKGVREYRSGWKLDGVIAVQTGSRRHGEMLARALDQERLPPLIGTLPRHDDLVLPERHLGLVDVRELEEKGRLSRIREKLSELTADWDWERVCSRFTRVLAAPSGGGEEAIIPGATFRKKASSIRLGVAWDSAFRFYYPENWSALEERGIQLVPVSPQSDRKLPADLDGLYLGGGYPEHFAGSLADNRGFLSSVRDFHANGGVVYAECGGMLYLSYGPEHGQEDQKPDWVGILPFRFRMNGRLKRLGYIEARPVDGGFWKEADGTIRGHLFHYSEPIPLDAFSVQAFAPAFIVQEKPEGFQMPNLVASYLHLYFPSNPSILNQFVEALRIRSASRILSSSNS